MRWLGDESGELSRAVDEAVEEGHLRTDIFHRLQEIEYSCTKKSMESWATKAGADINRTADKTILCLHAGNLPLVGFQDLIAVLISGYEYIGKISKRDRALMSSLLTELSKTELAGRLRWQTALDQLNIEAADAVMFSGSEETIPVVWKKLHELGCTAPPECRLIRTAVYSVAWMERCSAKDLHDLSEAFLRHQGSGCRSVKVVVSPLPLEDVKAALQSALDHWLNENDGLVSNISEREIAFAKATGKSVVASGPAVIRSEHEPRLFDGGVAWIRGDRHMLNHFLQQSAGEVQSVYIEHSDVETQTISADRIELLSKAQSPELSWKPDGIDPLEWLTRLRH